MRNQMTSLPFKLRPMFSGSTTRCCRRVSTSTAVSAWILMVTVVTQPRQVDSYNWMYLGLQSASLSSSIVHHPLPIIPSPSPAAAAASQRLRSASTTSAASAAASAAAAAFESLIDECSKLPGLVHAQLEVCERNPMAMPCVGLGARLGLYECRYQFQYERWNCTLSPLTATDEPIVSNALQSGNNATSVDALIQLGTKETAFVYAATSAGVAHAVTEACSAGSLTECTCDVSRHGETTPDGWKWGGCSDNIQYGLWFSENFVDAPDRSRPQGNRATSVRALMNLHNNEVGRKTLSQLMKMRCRCHGVSGSCGVKTCWRSIPSFREVGDQLKKKYENSVEISPRPAAVAAAHASSIRLQHDSPYSTSSTTAGAALRRREKRKRREPIADTELVYVDRSPNYCRPDPDRGVPGTKGRECRRGSYGPESCESLCCGRGFNVEEIRRVERCHCRFVWCCEVKCKSCETLEKRYTCK